MKACNIFINLARFSKNLMEIKNIGIVGSGTMACQIAEHFLRNNYMVTLYSRNDQGIRRCADKIGRKIPVGGLRATTNLGELKECDFLVESVVEDLEIKQEIFESLEGIAKAGAIIASNTSSIPIKMIAKNCRNKENILGVHFFNPVSHIALVEVARTDFVSDEAFNSTIDLIKKIGKEPVVVKDTPGYICNRILFAMLNEAANILSEGVSSKEDIDRVMTLGALHPAGPLKIIDLVGIDVTVDILKNLQKELDDNKFSPSPILMRMLKENRLGRKTKKGFYDY